MNFYSNNYPEDIVNKQIKLPTIQNSPHTGEYSDCTLTCKIINELFWNYSTITTEKNQIDVLKNILLPNITTINYNQNNQINNSTSILSIFENETKSFFSSHKEFLSKIKFIDNHKISIQEQVYDDIEINTIEEFHDYVNTKVQQYKSDKILQIKFINKEINIKNVLKLIDENPTNVNLLIDSILISFFNSDLNLLLKSFEKIFSFNLLQNDIKIKNDILNNCQIKFDQNYNQQSINISMQYIDYIIHRTQTEYYKFYLDIYRTCSILATTPNYILFKTYYRPNEEYNLIKINVHKYYHPDSENKKMLRFDNFNNLHITAVGNDVFIFNSDDNSYYIYDTTSEFKVLKLKRRFSKHFGPPFTSDGFFIYSIISDKEIGVFNIDKSKYEFVLHHIVLVEKSTRLDPEYNESVLCNILVSNSLLVTNGIVLQLIMAEKLENNKFTHFARVISLENGKHIKDFRFEFPYRIYSICIEPISKVIWILTVLQLEILIVRCNYEGPEPPWLSKVNLPCLSNLFTFKKFNQFCISIIDFCQSTAFHYFGIDNYENKDLSNFCLSFICTEYIDSILLFLAQKIKNTKFVQFLFVLLSFQIRQIKLSNKQANDLYDVIQYYIMIPHLHDFLTLFLINITNSCKSIDVSRYFGLLFQFLDHTTVDIDNLLCKVLRLKKSKKFPFIFANNLPIIMYKLIDDLYNCKITDIGIDFLNSFQVSIFLNYSRILDKNPQKIKEIDTVSLEYTTILISKSKNFLKNYDCNDKFDSSPLIILLNRLLIDLNYPINYSPSPWNFLPLLIELSKEFLRSPLFSSDIRSGNLFHFMFANVINLSICCFKKIVSFPNINDIKKHLVFIKNSNKSEKTVSFIFNNKLNDEDFNNVVDLIYSKVPNILNKRLSKEDKEFEKTLLLSIIYKTHEIDSVIDINNQIKNKENIQISPSIKSLIQEIYKIRSYLRLKKQNNPTDYLAIYTKYNEKSHFILKSSTKKMNLKKIIDFYNEDVQVSQLLEEKKLFESISQRFVETIKMMNNFVKQNFSIDVIMLFMNHVFINFDIFSIYELNFDSSQIYFDFSINIIRNILKCIDHISMNYVIHFIFKYLILASKMFKPEDIHDIILESIKSIMTKICKESNKMSRKLFKVYVSLFSHFNRYLYDKKIFIMEPNERENISQIIIDNMDMKCSMSLSFNHSLLYGLFSISQSLDFIKSILGFVSSNEFHRVSLILFDFLQLSSLKNNEYDFLHLLSFIMNIIGSIVSGSQSEYLLQSAIPINNIEQGNEKAFVRASKSQISCILELIQIIRKLMINTETNSALMIKKHFDTVIGHFNIDDSNEMKQIYSIIAILSNNLFKMMRPNIIVKTNDNNSYYIKSIDENNQKIEGIKIPVLKGEIIHNKIDFSDVSEFHEPIELNKSNFNIIGILNLILKKVINMETASSSSSLLSFLLFQSIRENMNDIDHDNEFHELIFSLIKKKGIKQFRYSNKYSKTILSLLEKSLLIQTEGVFTNNSMAVHMHHAAFTKLVFDNDFVLTSSQLQANKSPHVFVSSILNDEKPMYFCVKYENNQQIFNFGIIMHSINNNSTTILYSLNKSQFLANGEKIIDYKLDLNNSIECCFSPQDNIVSFADSNKKSIIFSCDLGIKSKCSFIISIHPGTTINYSCDSAPQIDCVLAKPDENICIKLNKFNQDNKIIELLPEIEINDFTDKIIDLQTLFLLCEFDYMTQTNIFLEKYQNAYSNSSLESISSSPIQLENYLRIQNISGEFDLIDKDQSSFEPVNFIPSFNNNNYHYLPSEILNYYIKEACEFQRDKIFMSLTKSIIVKTMNISKAIENLFPSITVIVNFITYILFLLDPINFYHLNDEKCPIDFVSFNSLEKCHKSNLYDYFIAIKRIFEYFKEDKMDLLINTWLVKLKNDFNNKYLHFCSQSNENLQIVKSSIVDSYQYFDANNASGWIIFPYKFGCYHLPSIQTEKIFPKSFDDHINYIYCCKKTLKIKANYKINTSNDLIPFGILPIFDKSNESLFDSFYQMIISFKYFVLFAKDRLSNETKDELWKLVFNSIMAGSPFFYSHSRDVLSFLNSQIQFPSNKLSLLYQLNAFNNTIKHKSIQHFINMILFNNNFELAKKYANSIFNNESTPNEIQFPNEIIPKKLDSFSHLNSLIKVIPQIFAYDDSKEFPIYLFVREWIEAFINYPPCEIKVVEPNILKIEFTAYAPLNGFSLHCNEISLKDITTYISSTIDFNESSINDSTYISTYKNAGNKIFYIKFPEDENITNYNFVVCHSFYSFQYNKLPNIILEYKSYMFNDIKILCNEFTANEDHQILNLVYYPDFFGKEISTRLSVYKLKQLNKIRHPIHLIYLRGIYLIATNYLFVNEKSIKNYNGIEKLKKLLDINIIAIGFMNWIDSKSSEENDTLYINRQEALDYRRGLNKNEEKSMIAQFSKAYIANPNHFRNPRTPFKIVYVNEAGFDAGGLMRDFITEIIKDINTPEVGLFLQTPNGRNGEGMNQECIIPNPSPDIKNSAQYYHAVGAFLAIIIRTNMKQIDLNFPPFFWAFIADANLTIDDIYSIDNSYQKITSNFLHEFKKAENKDNLAISSISILNMRGAIIKIDEFDFINKSNYEEFIGRCNEIRLDELRNPMLEIRSGFWENMNFDPPVFTTGPFLESLICNEKFITVDELKKQIKFEDVPEIQQNFFWEVVSRMNKDEIKKLIHFSTGLTSLGPRGLTIDAYVCDVDSHLPSASTCFFKLNLPPFSSAEKMYNAFITAINEVSTFEKT